ncbi:hypothetical protein HYH03_000897 [Edaphochlamys debaryana]|uniref:Uncharacterized protein n=1 Tax=Edaphochlamys debaryana TaxID=47281 RepID=A0A835YNQ2_9CHLO|nr:hypothetical protein HYH03_000897 [Edaphochlamys debaryana]|eukprot:KAG2501079.1 hypothetical protein HYH03_000897 [Edaphochlamys debaryana]
MASTSTPPSAGRMKPITTAQLCKMRDLIAANEHPAIVALKASRNGTGVGVTRSLLGELSAALDGYGCDVNDESLILKDALEKRVRAEITKIERLDRVRIILESELGQDSPYVSPAETDEEYADEDEARPEPEQANLEDTQDKLTQLGLNDKAEDEAKDQADKGKDTGEAKGEGKEKAKAKGAGRRQRKVVEVKIRRGDPCPIKLRFLRYHGEPTSCARPGCGAVLSGGEEGTAVAEQFKDRWAHEACWKQKTPQAPELPCFGRTPFYSRFPGVCDICNLQLQGSVCVAARSWPTKQLYCKSCTVAMFDSFAPQQQPTMLARLCIQLQRPAAPAAKSLAPRASMQQPNQGPAASPAPHGPNASAPTGPPPASELAAKPTAPAPAEPATAAAGSRGPVESGAEGYRFSVDWMTPHAHVWREHVVSRLGGRPGLRALEIGCWEGRSAVWLLQHVASHPSARLVCVDPFDKLYPQFKANREAFEHNLAASGQRHRVTHMHMESRRALPRLLLAAEGAAEGAAAGADESAPGAGSGSGSEAQLFDLIYIDGSHMRADVLSDAVMSWQLLKVGGVLVFDDYEWDQYTDNLVCHPRQAVDAFLQVFAHQLRLVSKGYQVMVERVLEP